MDENDFLAAIRRDPQNRDRDLEYAIWLEDQDPPRSELLRAWLDLVRTPFGQDTADRLQVVRERYRSLFFQLAEADRVPWLRSLNKARPWINPEVAETFVRIILLKLYGLEVAEGWKFKVTPCLLDDRWSVKPTKRLPVQPGTSRVPVRFFVSSGFGDVEGVSELEKAPGSKKRGKGRR